MAELVVAVRQRQLEHHLVPVNGGLKRHSARFKLMLLREMRNLLRDQAAFRESKANSVSNP